MRQSGLQVRLFIQKVDLKDKLKDYTEALAPSKAANWRPFERMILSIIIRSYSSEKILLFNNREVISLSDFEEYLHLFLILKIFLKLS